MAVSDAMSSMDSLFEENRFVEPRDADGVRRTNSPLFEKMSGISNGILFRLGLRPRWMRTEGRAFIESHASLMDRCRGHNRALASWMAGEVEDVVTPGGRRLNRDQLLSIVMDVRSRLLIAGAGTGKTMTVAGLAEFLFMVKGVDPSKVLFISYTNAAVDEMRSRIRSCTGSEPEVRTFHSLARTIIAESDGIAPRVSNIQPERFMREYIESHLSDRRFIRSVIRYLSSHRYEEDDKREEFESEHPWITINRERVKSRGEAEIADHLFTHGIRYAYEEPYRADTGDSTHGGYRPDFHILGTDVYIEYFGIDRNGNVPRSWLEKDPRAERKYLDGIGWKKSVHQRNGTRLIQLFSYERFEGTLLESLEGALRENGIEDGECDEEYVLKRLSKGGRSVEQIARTVASLATLLKSRGYAFPKGRNKRESASIETLERIASPMLSAYERELERRGEMDFQDLLMQSARRIGEGAWANPFEYVVVDEYQDISPEKMDILIRMRASKDYRLFCVGDDWQSIYRFNGGNVGFITEFERHWGPSEIMGLHRTYRYSGELLDLSCRFMNGCMMPKSMTGDDRSDTPVTFLTGPDERRCMGKVAETVASLPMGESVLFLGRFHHDVVLLGRCGLEWSPRGDCYAVSSESRRGMVFRTIHSSKGVEADHVFILNNMDGPGGFPDSRPEAPIADIVLEGSGSKMDEERRLFYVAMTRARKSLHVVTVKGSESLFAKELAELKRRRMRFAGQSHPSNWLLYSSA